MEKKAIVLLADGFEEVEALTPVDYLRRAGIRVVTAAIGESRTVIGARKIPVVADTTLTEWRKSEPAGGWDAVILPGGMPGSANLAASAETGVLLGEMAAAGKWLCAICAAPALVLFPLGLLAGRAFTCFPGMEEDVHGGRWLEDRVVTAADSSGGIITARSAGCAGEFAVAIIGSLLDRAEGDKIAASVLL